MKRLLRATLLVGGILQLFIPAQASAQQGWIRLQPGITISLYSVSFASELIGIAAGGRASEVYRTTDGGAIWQHVVLPSGIDSTWSITKIHFVDEQRGYLVGGKRGGATPDQALVLSTTDGGASWQSVALDESLSQAVYYDISFPSQSVGYIDGGRSTVTDGVLAKTTDGGLTWQRIAKPGGHYYYYEAEFRDEENGMVIGGMYEPIQMSLWRTADGGVSWSDTDPGINDNPNMMSARNITHVGGPTWVVSANDRIARTADDGATWDSVFATGREVIDITFADSQMGYAVGANTTEIWKTVDGGLTWRAQQANQGKWLTGVSAPSTRVAYGVGHDGTIIKTGTGGELNAGVSNVGETGSSRLHVAPNPSRGTLLASFAPSVHSRHLVITDALGRTVYHANIDPHSISHRLETGNLTPGLYICRIASEAIALLVAR